MKYLTKNDWDYVKSHPFYEYIEKVEDGTYNVGKYVKLQVEDIKNSLDSEDYYLNIDKMKTITDLTKLINFADGELRGKSTHDGLAGFQWFLLISVLAIYRKDTNKRRFRNAVLLIARKNGKVLPLIWETIYEKLGKIGGGLKKDNTEVIRFFKRNLAP